MRKDGRSQGPLLDPLERSAEQTRYLPSKPSPVLNVQPGENPADLNLASTLLRSGATLSNEIR